MLDFLGIVYGILSRKQLKLRLILGKKGILDSVSDFEKRGDIGDTHWGLWEAGAIVLSSGGILAQRNDLLRREIAPWEILNRKNLFRRKHNISIDQKQSFC